MIGILLAFAIGASGDPYILRVGATTPLSGAQDSALQTLVNQKFASVTYADIQSILCQTDEAENWSCTVSKWETPSASEIRASLIKQVPWIPDSVPGKWLIKVSKTFVGSGAWRTHAQSVWSELAASPMLVLKYERMGGVGTFIANLQYMKSMNQSGIAAAVAAGETLIPNGVTP
jgi:hypothetical protein